MWELGLFVGMLLLIIESKLINKNWEEFYNEQR